MNLQLRKLSPHQRGEAIVLIHGWAMNSFVWQPLVDAMPDYCFYGLDLPGHGCHADIDYGDDIEQWHVQARVALLEADLGRCHIIGWSLGGMLATKIAAAQPCASLTLLASNPKFVAGGDWPNAMPALYLQRFMENLQQDIKQVVRDFMELQVRGAQFAARALETLLSLVEQGGLASEQGLHNGLSILQGADTRVDLSKVRCPINIVLGKRDTLVPAAVADDLRCLQPDIPIHILPKSGHAPFVSHTIDTAALLQAFLSSCHE